MLVTAGQNAWLNSHLLSSRVFVFIGLISYPINLWHWPLLAYISVYGTDSTQLLRLLKAAALVASFAAAISTYLFLERPLRRCSLTKLAVGMSGALVVFVVIGAVICASNGVPNRFSRTEQALLEQAQAEKNAFSAALRPGCFLERHGSFSDRCKGGTHPVLLWGDSHAADLFPGLARIIANPDHDIAIFTMGACPPVIGLESSIKGCSESNETVLAQLGRIEPKTVVLSAFWTLYYKNAGFAAALTNTIRQLKAERRKLILVGPAVVFPKSQVRYLLGRSKESAAENTFLEELRSADGLLQEIATAAEVAYISPISTLCFNTSCTVLVPDRLSPRLFAWDYGHLTRDGSDFYARVFLRPALLGADFTFPPRHQP